MDRREFLLGIGATALPISRAFSAQSDSEAASDDRVRIDGDRVNRRLRELSLFGRTEEGGISRVAYSDADREGRAYAMAAMGEAGLDVHIDVAGNIVGRRAGTDLNLPPIAFGSHIDSVPHGGNFDGQVGSMGAIEVAQTLSEAGIVTRHPLEVLIFQNEENGKTGSRALSGEVEERELDLPSHSGKTIGEGITFIGGDPSRLGDARREPGSIACYLELHVEQGAVLHGSRIDIGVVEGIVGIMRWNVTVEGFANHAGTTPMNQRRDAMLTAGRFIDLVNTVVTETPGRQVGTVGKLEAHPGAPNVVPGRVALTLEIRDLEMTKIESIHDHIVRESREVAQRNETSISFDRYYVSRAAPTHPSLQTIVARSAETLGLTKLSMPSGAGHDAQSIALLAPVGMIFVPSVDGISHSPKELTRPEDVANGTAVLLGSLLAADAMDHPA
jgi:N-carbamoyl-L-amino-acid hydrolase